MVGEMQACGLPAARSWCGPETRDHAVWHEVAVVHAAIVQSIQAVLLHQLLLMKLLQLLLLKDLEVDRSLAERCTSGRATAGLLQLWRSAVVLQKASA